MFKKILTNPFVFFPLFTCIVFWPVSLKIFTLKNDALTYYYPVRTLISDALHNYELPLWTPYINMGYPLHADMQSGAWSPVIWIFSLLTNYSLYGFHLELLFYFSFAGVGLYYLGKSFGFNKYTALIAALAWQYSGFMIDSVQFFVCIAAACYLPWIFLFFKRLLASQRVKDALATGLFLYLLFTGSYPALFIITAYLLIAFFLFVFFTAKQKYSFAKINALPIALMAGTFVLLSLPAILSFAQHLAFIGRGKKQALEFVQQNSLVPQSLISFVSPFSTTASAGWLNTDPLMRNSYMGIIPLLFFLTAILNKSIRRIKTVQFLFFTGLAMFALALGSHFLLHKLAYYALPLFNSFRHPAIFRLFGIFCWLMAAGFAMNNVGVNKDVLAITKKIHAGLTVGIIALSIILVIIFNHSLTIFSNGSFAPQNFKYLLGQFSFIERYLIQLPFVLAILLLCYMVLKKENVMQLLLVICMADFFISTQLNMPVTVIGAKKYNTVITLLNRNPEKFPLPGNTSIEINSANAADTPGLSKTKIPFEKRIGRNDYYITPGNLSLQDKFYESAIRDKVFKNPLAYFADTLIFQMPATGITTNAFAILDSSSSFIKQGSVTNKKGSVVPAGISANSFSFQMENTEPSVLVFLQNYYPGWKASIDGKETAIEKANITFMCIQVPKGRHSILFHYQPALIKYAWYVSFFCLITVLIILSRPLIFSLSSNRQ